MKLTTIKNALATVTDTLAGLAQHVPPITPKPAVCAHCGK